MRTSPRRSRKRVAVVCAIACAALLTGLGLSACGPAVTANAALTSPGHPAAGRAATANVATGQPGCGRDCVVTIEDTKIGTGLGTVQYAGRWTRCGACGINTGDDSYYYSHSEGATATIRFTGSRLVVFGVYDPVGGRAQFRLDGARPVVVDTNAHGRGKKSFLLYDTHPVSDGLHTVVITAHADPRSTNTAVVVFDKALAYSGHAQPTAVPTQVASSNPIANSPAPVASVVPTKAPPAPPVSAPAAGAAPHLLGAGVGDAFAWANWLGRPASSEVWETWNNFKTWGEMESMPTIDHLFTGAGPAPNNVRWPGKLSFSQTMINDGGSVAACASGAYDSHMTTIATNLKNKGWGTAYIRLGWEFNGYWFAQNEAYSDPGNWVTCWQHWYSRMKAVPGTNFRFVWNPNWGTNTNGAKAGFDPRTVWPGDNYVDAAGPDYYDWNINPNAANWAGGVVGINSWVSFVRGHGKTLAFPEWGLNTPNGGSDDASFINQVFDVFDQLKASGGLEYASYYNLGGCTFEIHIDGCNANAANAYRTRAAGF